MVEFGERVPRQERVKRILAIAKELSESGYKFSSYLNLARAIHSISLESWDDRSKYIGLCPKLIRKVLIEHKEYVDSLFRGKGNEA